MKTYKLFIVVLSLIVFSCSENQEITESTSTDIVTFKDVEEYKEVLNEILSMGSNERKEYEESKGYLSFGRKCDEFYSSIDFDQFKTFEELEGFIEKNSDLLVLKKAEDGELYLETVYNNNYNRYFMNNDRIFRVGNEIYKVFEDGVVISDICNMEKLQKMTFNSINLVVEDEDYHILNQNIDYSDSYRKDIAYDCGIQAIIEEVNDRDKTRVTITSAVENYQYNSFVYCSVVVRPYKKTLGVWLFCSRTISADITVAFDWFVFGEWQRTIFSGSTPGIGDSVWSFSDSFYTDDTSPVCHIGGYDGWADTPSTPTVIVECNTGIL